MQRHYRLIHALTGYTVGDWTSQAAAECYRNTLDDWTLWSVEEY